MASMDTRLNIKKLNENIVQKHGGSKQVGFKQLGPGVETGVHGLHDEKHVWFEVELQGAQGDRTGSMQVLHEFEFKVEPLGDHTFKVEPQENVDQGVGLQEVQTQYLMDYQLACNREQHLACELFRYREDSNEAAFAVGAVEKIYAHESLNFNNTVSLTTAMAITGSIHQGLLVKAKGNVLSLEIIKDQGGNTLRVSQSKIHNGMLVKTLLKGHSILSLKDSLSRDYDVEKNGKWSCIYAVGSQEYQMVYTILNIASVDVGMLDKFDHGLQTDVQVFVDFDYAMGRSITVMGYELRLVAGIATGALVKGYFRSEVPAQVKVVAYRY
ncbi:hypothetical protein Tco_0037779 [Tanacetum coccineum]